MNVVSHLERLGFLTLVRILFLKPVNIFVVFFDFSGVPSKLVSLYQKTLTYNLLQFFVLLSHLWIWYLFQKFLLLLDSH